jgi:hypothetical protein
VVVVGVVIGATVVDPRDVAAPVATTCQIDPKVLSSSPVA